MPLFTICAYPGCHMPAPRGERYCDRHKEVGVKRDAAMAEKAKKYRDARRRSKKGSTAQRGYGGRWQALRKRFISQHPYCEQCMKEGRLTPATDVDHIKPHRGCYSTKTTCRPSAMSATAGRQRWKTAALVMGEESD